MAKLTADELAFQFFSRGMANRWLSAKQTSFLYSLACDPKDPAWGGSDHGRRHAFGRFIGQQMSVSWSIALSPVNGCAVFSVRTYTLADAEKEVAEKTETVANIRQTMTEDEIIKAAGHGDFIFKSLSPLLERCEAELAGAIARRDEIAGYVPQFKA